MSIILILSIAALFYHPKGVATTTTSNNNDNGGQYSVIPVSAPSVHSTETPAVEVQAADVPPSDSDDSPPKAMMNLAPKVWTDPWLNGFGYRKPISISGSGTTLTDFQVNVTPYIYNETGLVGSWHFSESGGRTTADSSGYGNNGLLVNGANHTLDGKVGNAMKFDGTDDYVDVGNAGSLNPAYITLEAWIKPTNQLLGSQAIAKRDNGYTFFEGGNDWLYINGAWSNRYNINSFLTNNVWQHVVNTYDGVTSKAYVNGTLVASSAISGTLTQGSTAVTSIGSADYARAFNGIIDEVRIYNRSLSASEIQQHYLASKARLDYADIRFTDATGTTLLPFWMESDGKFWVKVPSIPTTGTTIYAYYGNPQANDAQNGTGTFMLFDDFNRADGALGNGWTTVAGTASVSGNKIVIGDTGSQDGAAHNPATGDVNSIVLASDVQLITASSPYAGTMVRSTSTGSYLQYGYGWLEANNANIVIYDGGSAVTANVPFVFTLDTWYNQEVIVASDNSMEVRIWRKGTTRPSSPTISKAAFTPSANDGTGVRMMGAGEYSVNHAYFDDFRLRKYASSPEPSATQGTEESLTTMSGGAQNWTWKVPTVGEKVRTGGAQDWNWKPFQQYLGRYRKPISISGSGTTLTDYQVNVTPYIYNETGLVGSWHFSESSGNATADSSGYGNTGYQYGTNRTTDGRFGNAMKFDGTDDYVDVGNSASLNIVNAITIEAWINPNSLPHAGNPVVIGKSTPTVAEPYYMYALQVPSTTMKLVLSIDGVRVEKSGGTLTAGVWNHIVGTYDGSYMNVYVNGVQQGTAQAQTGSISTNTVNVNMGRFLAGNSDYFNGTIDEVRIYNRTLSASEIQQQYQATKARLDYADIRFTDSDGATLLPFWMESDGKFWVKVPSIPTTGTTIYAYYGNPQANDAQNGTGTFEVFADFEEGGIPSGYSVFNGAMNWDSTTHVYSGTQSLVATVDGTVDVPNYPTTGKIALEEWFYSTSIGTLAYPIYDTDAERIGIKSSHISLYANSVWYEGSVILSSNTWYRLVLVRDMDNNLASAYVYDTAGTLLESIVGKASGTTHNVYGMSVLTTTWIDAYRQRKYASSPEPSAVNGTDEDSPIPQNITVPVGNAMNWTWYPS